MYLYLNLPTETKVSRPPTNQETPKKVMQPLSPQLPIAQPQPTIPKTKVLENTYHIFQTFNNCGPASLSMALSYFDIYVTQDQLGRELRPYQNPQGDNDDKSVTLAELATKALEYDLIPYHRPNGTIDLVKQFIVLELPVIARTRSTENDDIGHYRVVKGYDDVTGDFIQDDSLQGHNLRYTYPKFIKLWQMYNYEYLVLVPKSKRELAERILGADLTELTAWKSAVATARHELALSPNDMYAQFNLAVALYHTGDFQGSVTEFEKVETRLPIRTLWYQIEPIQAYFELGKYERVFELTDAIFNNNNRAFSELYVLRGKSYEKLGDNAAAKTEFAKAVFYSSSSD